jgi:hypothetical protein
MIEDQNLIYRTGSTEIFWEGEAPPELALRRGSNEALVTISLTDGSPKSPERGGML